MARNMTIGIVADGAFKVLLAAVYGLGAVPVGRQLGVAPWLMIASAVALLICGEVEIRYVRRRSARTCTRLMVGYDAGWALTAAVGLLLARSGSSAGGEVWIGYQLLAAPVFAAVLARGREVGPAGQEN
ncbi:hypothetical protein [Kitasatospora sp. CB01950]|uniref:hypothetical protein n=1 Tax=Kitasatospora sp. CB01950 TaxID=1703930 RepID=UPI00093F8732|nr:hypothetical protein [Kitasatospora sp. CB01950]OKJ03359.1 hypothetical protein AMK19_27170 [Kitasatospora sp. CB01950]